MSKQLYYTENRLEEALVPTVMDEFQGGHLVQGVDYNRIATIPGPVGATTFPAQGPFSTPVDIEMQEPEMEVRRGRPSQRSAGSPQLLWVVLAGIVVFYLLVPR